MQDLSQVEEVYGADTDAIVPWWRALRYGTGCAAVAQRRAGTHVRNGWFSYRWITNLRSRGLRAETTEFKARAGQCRACSVRSALDRGGVSQPSVRRAKRGLRGTFPRKCDLSRIIWRTSMSRAGDAAHEVGAILVAGLRGLVAASG
jgi:hypothetical protein